MSERFGITKRQREAFDWLSAYIDDHGYSPSFREIMDGLGMKSVSQVSAIVKVLEQRNYVKRLYGLRRSITICD
jgi:repressor LexA